MAYPAAKSGFTLEDLTRMGPDEITRKRKIAEALLAQSQGIKRIEHPLEGMAQMAQALIGNLKGARLDRAEREGKEGANALFSAGMGMGEFPAAPGGAPSMDRYAGMADGPKGQEEYGPGDDYFANIRSAESGGNDSAKNPNSSATGRYQFIGSTWDGLRRQHPELGLTADGRLDPNQQEKAIRQFTADNAKVLSSAGIPLTGGNLYAAHFLGSGGARKVLSSDPGASVAAIVGSDVVNANPFLRGMTVADFSRWAAKKGGSGPINLGGGQALEQLAGGSTIDPREVPALVAAGQNRPDAFAYARPGATIDPSQVPGLVAAGQNRPDAVPRQVASLDPSAGMQVPTGVNPAPNQAAIGQALIEQGIDPNGPQAQAFASIGAGGGVPPPAAPAAQNVVPPAAQAPLPQQQQMAQALIADPAQTLGAPAIQPGGPDMRTLMGMAGNEFMSPQQQKLIEALTGQRMEQEAKRADPAYQMGLEKSRLEIDAMKNPQMTPAQKAEYDLNVQKFGIEQADRIAKQADVDADNRREDEKFDLDRRQANLTPGIKEYEAYKRDEANAGRVPLGRLEYEQALRKSGANNTSVSVGGGENKQVFDAVAASAEKAQAALTGFNAIQEANKALDSGIISGAGADMRLGLQKLGALFGADPTAIQNTETFRSAIAPQIASMIKATVGSANISNTDREFAEKAVGGNIELDAGSIKRLMGIMEKMGRETIKRHRSIVDKVYPEGGGFDRERALFGVDALPEAAAPAGGGESIDDIIKRNR